MNKNKTFFLNFVLFSKKFFNYVIITLLIFFLTIHYVNANQGCCSWHGGISHCGENGYYICNDGTQSPSCRCNTQELTDTSCDCTTYDILNNRIIELDNNVKRLQEENQNLKNSKINYQTMFWITLIIFIIYFYYKNHKKNIN